MDTGNRTRGFLVTFLVLFVFWLLLSWHFDPEHLLLGLISSILVAYFFGDLLRLIEVNDLSMRKIILLIRYMVYLAYSILLANIDVAYRVLHPNMPINPRIVKFRSRLRSDIGRTVLANSITLTPGTITINVEDGTFYVHALSEKSAEELLEGGMEKRLLRIFGGERDDVI
jgi:multicomponent Na+:H+ antiporter subunit E